MQIIERFIYDENGEIIMATITSVTYKYNKPTITKIGQDNKPVITSNGLQKPIIKLVGE